MSTDYEQFRTNALPAAMRAKWIASRIIDGSVRSEAFLRRIIADEITTAERHAVAEAEKSWKEDLKELRAYRQACIRTRPGKTKIAKCMDLLANCITADASSIAAEVGCDVSVAHNARRRLLAEMKRNARR